MNLVIDPRGEIRCLYAETLDLTALGSLSIRRASHVEPDLQGAWWIDLGPVNGPQLGPFALRSQALEAERAWLDTRWLARRPRRKTPMSDRMSAEIKIGGPVAAKLVGPLITAIESEGLRVSPDENPFTARTAEELLELAAADSAGVLHLLDHEVAWGRFEHLERVLVEHKIAFDRWSDSKYEYDAEIVQYRLGMREPIASVSTQAQERIVHVSALKAVEQALARGHHRRALKLLRKAMGPEIPPLEPLTIIPERSSRGPRVAKEPSHGDVRRRHRQQRSASA